MLISFTCGRSILQTLADSALEALTGGVPEDIGDKWGEYENEDYWKIGVSNFSGIDVHGLMGCILSVLFGIFQRRCDHGQ